MAAKFIIAIDLGGTNLRLALLDLKYKIKYRQILNTQKFIKKEDLILAIINSVNRMIKTADLSKANILGIGLGLPGPIDPRGIVHFFPNIAGWKEVDLKYILEKKLKLPVFLDNDANLMSLAEFRFGAAKGYKQAICLTLGTGVGGGIILEGGLYRGANNATGEIGHIPINERGPHCNCGGRACLETYVGNKRILQEAKRLFKQNISLEKLSSLAKKGNAQALKIWSGVGLRLGIALTAVVNLLNPEIIVIGGGVAQAGKILFAKVRKTILERAMSVQARQVKVVKAKLATNAGLIGAAILVREAGGR